MNSFTDWVVETVSELGVGAKSLGMFVTAVLDSSLVSLPEINDALLCYLTTLSPSSAPYFVLAATLGSIGGCLLLNRIAHWKGPEFISSLLTTPSSRKGIRLYQRYGAWTLLVPALLPPPCPFKIFVVSSGALGMELHRFLLAIAVGRSLRYSLGAILAVRYGRQALDLLNAYAPYILGIAAIALVVVAMLAVRRLHRAGSPLSGIDTLRGRL